MNGKNNLSDLNEIWKSGALEDFIRRMLVYYDPMSLVILGAPHDEYDSDIPKIMKMILKKGVTINELSEFILDLYKSNDKIENIAKKSQRMAEDLLDLKNS